MQCGGAVAIGNAATRGRQTRRLRGRRPHPTDRRRYAAVEAVKLGHGGVEYIADLFDCDPHTIRHGERDIEQLPTDEAVGIARAFRKMANGPFVVGLNRADSIDEKRRTTSRSR